MLLKKQQKDNKTKVIYKSSTICASILDESTKDLTVIFNNGGQYRYTAVGTTDYVRFETGDSQGSILNTHIKKYPFTKLDPVDVTAILKEIEELSNVDVVADLEEKTKEMFHTMLGLLSFYIDKKTVREAMLIKLEREIGEYNKAVTLATSVTPVNIIA